MAKEIETTGLKKFKTNPQIATYVAPTEDEEFAPKKYVDDNTKETQYFGDGHDGDLIATSAQNPNNYFLLTGVSNKTITLSPAGCGVSGCANMFAVGDKILILQIAGATAGEWEIATIASVAYSTITVRDTLTNTYTYSQYQPAQVVKMPQYDTVAFKTGSSLNIDAWDGEKGGIFAIYAKEGVVIDDGITLAVNEKGLRGGQTYYAKQSDGYPGEGCDNLRGALSKTTNRNGNGGGGGKGVGGSGVNRGGAAGHLKNGVNEDGDAQPGNGFIAELSNYHSGNNLKPFIFMGAGGGSAGINNFSDFGYPGVGGKGGGIFIIIAPFIISLGNIRAKGQSGQGGTGYGNGKFGGPGSGGFVGLFSPMIYLENEPNVDSPNNSYASKGIALKGYPDKCLPSS